jgi:hypothetical protein
MAPKIFLLLLLIFLVCLFSRPLAGKTADPQMPSGAIIAEEIDFAPGKKPDVMIKYYECRGKKPVGELKTAVLPFFSEEMAKTEMAKIKKGARFHLEAEFGLYFTCPVTRYILVPES